MVKRLSVEPAFFTLYTLQFTLYTLQFTLCTLHFALYTLQFTLYTLHDDDEQVIPTYTCQGATFPLCEWRNHLYASPDIIIMMKTTTLVMIVVMMMMMMTTMMMMTMTMTMTMMMIMKMIVMMMRDLGKGGKGGVKTIRGFWLNHSIMKASVDWIPGVMIVTVMLTMTSGVVKMMTLVMMTVMIMICI